MQTFYTVFDASVRSYSTWRAALPASTMAIVCVVAMGLARRLPNNEKSRRRFVLIAMVGGIASAFFALLILAVTWDQFSSVRRRLQANDFSIVEGRVANFRPELGDGHPRESFTVGADTFYYSSSDVSSAFHLTHARGGPIASGLCVRMATAQGAILRLEVAQHCPDE